MDDLISREAAIAEIDEYFHGLDSCISEPDLKLDGYKNGLQVAIQEVKALPAVEAVPVVHGKWVDEKGNPVPWCDALPSSPAYSCWCNQCGTWLVASDEYPVYGLFCPACGAKMDGKRRDDDAAD